MTITKRNIMVPVDQIEPHPDNPRKDVGDVTELAESIKKELEKESAKYAHSAGDL